MQRGSRKPKPRIRVSGVVFYKAETKFYELMRQLPEAVFDNVLEYGNSPYTFGSLVGLKRQRTSSHFLTDAHVTEEGAQVLAMFVSPHAAALFRAWLIKHDLWK